MGCGSSSQAKSDSANTAPEKKPDTPVKEVTSSEPMESPKNVETNAEVEAEKETEKEAERENITVVATITVERDDMREEVVLETKIVAPVKFDQQMGGHEGTFHKVDELKIMKHGGEAETSFYEEIHNYPKLQEFAPTFFGIKETDGKKYIVIEDLTAGFAKPCILDIKIGRQSYGEDADEAKKANMEAKDKRSTTWSLGARITAMKVYQNENGEYIKKGKEDGKDVKTEDFQAALSEYFHNGKELRRGLIPKFIEKIKLIQEWAHSQGDVRLYSSSILFVYDGEGSDDKVAIKLIDFAHVFKITDNGKDDGYIFGVNNVIQYLEAIHTQ